MRTEGDRRAILDTLHRYCTALDSRRWEMVNDVFLPDARVDFTSARGRLLEGAQVADWFRETMSRFSILQHFVSNVRITVEDDEVRSMAYVLAVHGYEGEDGSIRFFDLGGEYVDRFVLVGPGWRITDRKLIVRWIRGDVPKT